MSHCEWTKDIQKQINKITEGMPAPPPTVRRRISKFFSTCFYDGLNEKKKARSRDALCILKPIGTLCILLLLGLTVLALRLLFPTAEIQDLAFLPGCMAWIAWCLLMMLN